MKSIQSYDLLRKFPLYAESERPNILVGTLASDRSDSCRSCENVLLAGSRIKIDLGSIHSNGRLVRYFAGFLSYGFFGDNVQTAEKYRWMGPLRYTWTGWQTFLKNQSYSGQLRVKVLDDSNERDRMPICLEG